MRRFVATLALISSTAATLAPSTARAQKEAEVKTPASDLYVRKRPPLGSTPATPADLQPLLAEKEKQAIAKRLEAIRLLEQFLATNPQGAGAAEGLFKLAELYWEEARRQFVNDNRRYEREAEACRQRDASCKGPPRQPRLDLDRAAALYQRLVDEHPSYERIDIVKYLLGFAAHEGERHDDALAWFHRVIREHPDSALFTDSWMMIGEYYFNVTNDFRVARDAYAKVLERPDSPVYDLALFKSAWCDWKLGDPKRAGERFKQVLDLCQEQAGAVTAAEKRRRTQLCEEALDYLVVVFTEDEKVTAKDAYDFLVSIRGERYSREVLVRLANAFNGQARFDRAVQAFQFLIDLDPMHPEAPGFQISTIEAYLAQDEPDKALQAAKRLADDFGEKSNWARANKDRKKTVARAVGAAERTLSTLGKRLHEEAQRDEESRRRPDLGRYRRAADVYQFYLERFASFHGAIEIRYLRADINHFKLGKLEEAGDDYMLVGKSEDPPGTKKPERDRLEQLRKDALKKAMASYEKARPKSDGRRELTEVDKKFAEAADLYATRYPADPELVNLIFRNGQMFYDAGNYDESVKRFGLIVTKYPDHPDARSAGDFILEALVKGEDYENVEHWSRKLKSAKAFQSKEEQTRLDRLIVESINKSGEKYASKGEFEKAAGFYLRVASEFPEDRRAPTAIFNAATVLVKAKQPEKAAEAYLSVARKYGKSAEAPGSAFTAGSVFEQMAYFDRASEAFAFMARTYPDHAKAADALYNAGVLLQAQGKHKEAIQHYEQYTKRYKARDDVEEVIFRIAVVYEETGDAARAAGAFRGYAERYPKGGHGIEARTRAARAYVKQGQGKRAAAELTDAVKAWRSLGKEPQKRNARWAAEARYLQGELIFKDYQAISLNVKPKQLAKTLDKKSALLADATNVYIDVVEFGDAQWGTAALYRIGSMYEQFATELRDAPPPPGFTEEEQTVYREQLDVYVVQIEEKAIEAYETGYQKAISLKVYNEYTRKLREALGRLAESRYPPEREQRQRSRVGDRPPAPPILKDVVREE